jgi:hypothetical protein
MFAQGGQLAVRPPEQPVRREYGCTGGAYWDSDGPENSRNTFSRRDWYEFMVERVVNCTRMCLRPCRGMHGRAASGVLMFNKLYQLQG